MSYASTFPKGARWTPGKLVALRNGLSQGKSLKVIGGVLGVTAHDLDIACWTLVGRSLTQACDILNRVTP